MITQEKVLEALKNETGKLFWDRDALGVCHYVFSTKEATAILNKEFVQKLWDTNQLEITEETERYAKYVLRVSDKHVVGYKGARELSKLLKGRITYDNVFYPASQIKSFMQVGFGNAQRFEIRNKTQCLAVLYREDVNQDVFEVRYI